MSKSIVFMCNGQGSQSYHMGRELFEKEPVFRRWMLELDNMVYEIIKTHLVKIIYDEKKSRGDVFDRTLYTHPAIFMIECSMAKTFMEYGIKPDYLLGTSLGEFTSAALSEAMDLQNVLKCLIYHAQCAEKCCNGGGMLAIMNDIELYDKVPLICENSELSSVNYDTHFVVSGSNEKLNAISEYLKQKNILCQLLPVSFAFHSSLIEPMALEYKQFVREKQFRKPKINFISCQQGANLKSIPDEYFWNVTRDSVKFREAIEVLESEGEHIYIDIGMGGTLLNFLKRNLKQNSKSEAYAVITPFGQELKNFTNIKSQLAKTNNVIKERDDSYMLAYVFPGQGSQQKGMGGELFDEFKELTVAADKILGYSIKDLCLNDPKDLLGQTNYTQPALYVVNAFSYLKKINEIGKKPDYVAGHSLGEYDALFAAGVFDFETGLKLVKKRGELMALATGGGMGAVIGLKEEDIKSILKENNLENIDVANYNTPSQIVISGPKADIEKAKPVFEAKGARNYVVLKVSGAFHSRYMAASAKEFEQHLNQFTFSKPQIPVISNVYARPYKNSQLKQNMVGQITNSVKWTETIRYLMGKGEIEIEQIGPGTVLNGMIKNIKREAEPLVVQDEPDDADDVQDEDVKKDESIAEKRPKKIAKKAAIAENAPAKAEPAEEKGADKKVEAQPVKTQGKQGKISAAILGSEEFKKDYNLKYAYITGSMYQGISSKEMIVRLGKAGFMGFFGIGGLESREIEDAVRYIQSELKGAQPYGMNLLCNLAEPQKEESAVDLYLKYGVRTVEASAFLSITPALVRYRLKGLKLNSSGQIAAQNRIIAKVSRPEVAEAFLSPAPARIVERLLKENKITGEEAELSQKVPMADDLCAEADSGGHTDHAVSFALLPSMIRLRNEMMKKYGYPKKIRVGAAGGIGTPEAAAAAFIMGADFILTGSINQCTAEAGTSSMVKDLLQQINVQDTDYAPAGDMFEIGAKVQILKRGLFFPARSNKLYELYRNHNSINEIDEKTKTQLQEKYFKRSFDKIFEECKALYSQAEIQKAEANPKHKMALIFKWYFNYATGLALRGDEASKVDYQVMCGPAMGAFNQWVKGTDLESWKNRHTDEIGEKLMSETAELLNTQLALLVK